jgi:16S rRNA (adenine1518-N6/adenine1519-N6)-dimethyltransferase
MKAPLGQNFLISPTAPQAIAAAAGEIGDAVVLEIGPGMGVITHLLAKTSRRLVAIEYDRDLAATLTRQYTATPEKIDIIQNDILRVNLTALAEREGSKLVVVGNLPYYITSEILLHLYAHAGALDRAVLMIQREVADRLCASAGSRDYGLLTVTTQLYADVQRLFELTPEDFSPAPKVHSTVLRLHFTPRHHEPAVEPAPFILPSRTPRRRLRQRSHQPRIPRRSTPHRAPRRPLQSLDNLKGAICPTEAGAPPLTRSGKVGLDPSQKWVPHS